MIFFLIIGIIIFFIVRNNITKSNIAKRDYYNALVQQQNKEKLRKKMIINVSGPSISTQYDNSIIDVGSQSQKISTDYGLSTSVPYWSHSYVYSYNELNYASKSQKDFYFYFKDKFLHDIYLDIEGNNNYAFILLFDLLNEFDKHKNLALLEKQLQILGHHYSKTKSYGITFLIQKMKNVGDSEGIERLREDHYDYQNTNVNYTTFEWRNKFKKKLNLTKDEIKLLDKIWFSSNTFLSIDYCCSEIIKLYLTLVNKLELYYIDQNTTTKEVFDEVIDIVIRKHYRYRKGSTNYKYAVDSTEHEFYTNIFKSCENAVRESYANKRKITIDPYITTPDAKHEFENRIINPVVSILEELSPSISFPDESTELVLNQINTTRWKISFTTIVNDFDGSPQKFTEDIIKLGNLNKENPSVENIFYEASKFISKYDKPAALKMYIYYLYYDLNSVTFDNKQLTKSIQKSLFSNSDQLEIFQNIVTIFIKEKNINTTLASLNSVYAPKRKKIQLDSNSIKEVQQQHSGTVALLNEYLKDDELIEENTQVKSSSNHDEIKILVERASETTFLSIYSSDFNFSVLHDSALEIFAKNNYSLLQSEFEIFTKSKGIFKNQLIDSINEICYERLDDLLIEEDEDYYTINQNYYQKLLA